MLLSLLYKASPSEVRLILVDPKMLELSVYEDIPHLLTPVVTDMKEAANALRWCVGNGTPLPADDDAQGAQHCWLQSQSADVLAAGRTLD